MLMIWQRGWGIWGFDMSRGTATGWGACRGIFNGLVGEYLRRLLVECLESISRFGLDRTRVNETFPVF